jgi:hypothetical protein
MRTKQRQALVRALQKEVSTTERVMRQQFWLPPAPFASPARITPLKLR